MEDNTIMEVRESFMLSPSAANANDSEPAFRNAHFLKPISKELNQKPSFSCSVFEQKQLSLEFQGWRYPNPKWVKWVDQLKPKYESVWKKAGIFEPIMSTKSHIMKNQDLVYEVVDKWCSETNTFVFPFGEATITLEDVVVLGGFSLFGDPVFISLEGKEMKEIEEKLIIARNRLYRSKACKPRITIWMDSFIGKGSKIEHEAFLVTWLSIFVFPHKDLFVKSYLFPIAVYLARGKPIALAPAVLASLYRDLRSFKETIVGLEKSPMEGVKFPLKVEVNVQSPLYLVQVWVWERFKNLQPKPKLIKNGDHVLLRWHLVKPLKIDNVRLALDSAVDDFLWRPYVKYADKCGMFYPKDEILAPLKKDLDIGQKKKKVLDKKILSFVISLRVSELVGFESIEQYLPHRVAMQFGMDQDVPDHVPRFNETETIAWENYCRPLSDASLYIPSRFFDAGVTTRYATWWKRSASSSTCTAQAEIPLEFRPPKLVGTVTFGKSCDFSSKSRKGDDIADGDVPSGFVLSENSAEDGLNAEKNVDVDAHSSSTPKHNTLTPSISVVEDCNHVLEDVQSKDADESMEARLSSDDVCQAETQTESYSYLSDANIAELEQRISRLEIVHKELKMARLLP